MLRYIAIVALLLATPSFAQDLPAAPSAGHDRFVIANNECGAARFAHLVGRSYEVYRAALPSDAIVHGAGTNGAVNISHRAQRTTQATTLEFRPQRLNVVIDTSARILSVGCY